MSTSLYDKCIVEKLKKWTEKTDIHVYSPNETSRLFQVMADETNDAPIKLPILALRRNGGFTILNTNKQVRSYDGFKINTDEDLGEVITTNIIPIQLNYQLDIYTRYFEEADNYARDLVFNLMNHGGIKVTFNYNGASYSHKGYIRLESDVQNNSEIPERLVPGQFTRLTISFNVDDALLWNNVIRSVTRIDVDGLEVTLRTDIGDYTEKVADNEEFTRELENIED